MSRVSFTGVGLFMVDACGSLSGCVDMAQVAAMRDQAAALESQLDKSIAQQQEVLAKLDKAGAPPDDPARRAAQAQLDSAKTSRDAVAAAIKQVNLALEEANHPTDPISAGTSALAPFLPEPSRTPVILGGALLVTLLRARQMKTALVSVAKGLDKAMQTDQQFKASFQSHAALFRSVQTLAAQRVVDEATTDRFMVRLPV